MNEVVPVALGLLAGLLLGLVTARRRAPAWIAASVVLGVAATFLTGEWRVSWAFLLIDIPLVAVSAVPAYLLARRGARKWLAGSTP